MAGLVSLVGAVFLVPSLAWGAATILPNIANDENNTGPSCSLREAIQSANTDADFGGCTHTGTFVTGQSDSILLADGTTYLRTRADSAGDEDLNVEGDLDILDNLTIGMVPATTHGAVIQGNGTPGGGRVLEIGPGIDVQIADVTIRNGNSGSATEKGGGIQNHANTGSLTLTGVTVSGNHAGSFGGGIDSGGPANLTNVTISGNSTDLGGGGLFAFGGIHNLNNVTVTGNTADLNGDSAGANGDGGGIERDSSTINLSNTIVAGNFDASPGAEAPDCRENFMNTISLGYTLIGNTSGCSYTAGAGDVTNVPAQLGPLADNGGLTQTHGLLPGSPAIDAGNPASPSGVAPACASADQRGLPRGGAAGRCDIGAFEVQPPPATQATQATGQRAKALKKCKKKFHKNHKKKAFKKCKKKAKRLPV